MKIRKTYAKHLYGASRAFSLIELLTAMAVLAMVMAILLQVVSGISKSTQMQSQQMDSLGAARRALDTMAIDLSGAVVGEASSVLILPAANNLALVTDRRGTNSANHRFLAVTYGLNGSQLIRTYRSVSFAETDLLSAACDTNNSATSTLADGVLGLSIRISTASGPQSGANADTANYATNVYNGFTVPANWKALVTSAVTFASKLTNRAVGLDVWIAAVDEQNRKLLEETEKLAFVQESLGSDPAQWRANIDSAEMPLPAKSSIQVLNKSITFP